MALKKSIFGVIVALLFVGVSLGQEVGSQTPSESFTIKVSGQKTWGITLGFGDPTHLSLEGLEAGQLTLNQSLWAQIEGTVLDFLTIKASFNDQLGPGFQEFLVLVDRKPWYAELGRFVVGDEGEALGVYNKRVLGARITVSSETFSLSGLLARLEGISESLTFTGNVGQVELTFYYEDPSQPWIPAPYLASVEGFYFFTLRVPFIEGFSEPRLAFRTGEGFAEFLANWGLEYLRATAEKNAETSLPSGAYLVLQDEGDVLLLRQDPKVLLRNRVLDLIDLYNAAYGLTGTGKKEYPFVEGSELEKAFLSGLSAFTEIRVDEEAYPLNEARRQRYLSLGETGILEDSVVVEARLPGEREFRSLSDPLLSAYSVRVFSGKGVLRIDFPKDFFRSGAAIHTTFNYIREGGTFFLGLGVIPKSERVYLNGQLLAKDVDYAIDYEAGLLTLFVTIGPQDELRVDFERQRGALGVSTEYERYFLGATLGLGQGQIGVWQATDVGSPSPSSRTMPNTHSLAVLSWQGKLEEWDYSLRVGFSQNIFPPDDNARLPGRNKVNNIVSTRTADGEVLVFAHQNGITVYRAGRFFSYGAGEGLAGRAALSLLPLTNRLLIGTDAGLTIVDLTEPGAFDRIRSWTRLYPDDWNEGRTEKFQGTKVLALTSDGKQVYMATEAELIIAPSSALSKPLDWQRLSLPSGQPTVLLWAQALYLGTTEGLFRLSPEGWKREEVPGPIYALLSRGDELLVAGDEGIRVLRAGVGAGWVAYGVPVRSIALWRDFVWYIAPDGIYREGEQVLAGDFTALGLGLESLWAGTQADADFNLSLWRVDPEPERFPQTQTGIDGRDLGQFADLPAAGHTRSGPSASLSLSRKLNDWQLGIALYSRFPGYEEIGTSGRSDAHGVRFTARYTAVPDLSLTLSGRADITDLTTKPALRLSGGVEGTWKGPANVSFSLNPILSGLSRKTQFSSDFQAGFQAGENPAWNFGVSGKLTAPEFYLAGTMSGQVRYQPWSFLALSLSWSRPYRTRGAPGTETLTARAQLTGVTGYAWTLSWEENFSHPLDREEWSSSRNLSAELRLAPVTAFWGRLAPRATIALEATPAEWRVSGTTLANLDFSTHGVGLRFTAAQGFRPATERTDRAFSFDLSWSSSAWPGIQPSLNYTRSYRILLHPRYPPQLSEDQSLEARLGLDIPQGKSELVLTWAPEQGCKATNRLQYNFNFGPISLETSLTFKDGKISGKTEVEAALRLAPQWGLNISGGLLLGAMPVRVAVYLGATLAASF
ncbi:MAG: hypothetical protein NZ651_01860 [Candidatus Bipolaricaulota bacterium]|nr:hypothetical protein [Candidatus Bipolaricaulota bacterium]MDW8126504.1 hypothetical protein [Candidatus Bipolaricaulota bacterium]